jgi:hypothetical protein
VPLLLERNATLLRDLHVADLAEQAQNQESWKPKHGREKNIFVSQLATSL